MLQFTWISNKIFSEKSFIKILLHLIKFFQWMKVNRETRKLRCEKEWVYAMEMGSKLERLSSDYSLICQNIYGGFILWFCLHIWWERMKWKWWWKKSTRRILGGRSVICLAYLLIRLLTARLSQLLHHQLRIWTCYEKYYNASSFVSKSPNRANAIRKLREKNEFFIFHNKNLNVLWPKNEISCSKLIIFQKTF